MQVLRWCGTQASTDNAQSIIDNAVNEVSMRTTTPNWCVVLSCGVYQGKSRDAQCLDTCIPSGSRKSSQQRNSGGEFFAQSLSGPQQGDGTIAFRVLYKLLGFRDRHYQCYSPEFWNFEVAQAGRKEAKQSGLQSGSSMGY